MNTVENYLKDITSTQLAEYKRIRAIVHKNASEVEETISYGIPTFKYKGKYLLYFGAFKNHMSVFPGSEMTDKLKEKLSDYKISKGTIQFNENKPIPTDILKEIVRNRISAIDK